MNLGGSILGAALLMISAGMLLIFSRPNRKRAPIQLRQIPAVKKLRCMLGAAMEQGSRIHIGLGRGKLGSPDYASTFAALNSVESITRTTLTADQAPVSTSGDGATSLLGEDSVRAVYRKESTIDRMPSESSLLTGVTPFAYAGGSLPVTTSPDTSANILVGHYGPEAGLLTATDPELDAELFGGTDSLQAQGIFFNASENTLMGEEVFALPAYLDPSAGMLAGIMVQDLLRLVIIFGMLAGGILVIAGVL